MKYAILDNVNPTNTFQVEVEFMHGDADAYSTETIDIGLVAKPAEAILKYFNDHIGKRDYERSDLKEHVPHDSVYGYDYCAYVESVKMYWYTSSGIKREVHYEL